MYVNTALEVPEEAESASLFSEVHWWKLAVWNPSVLGHGAVNCSFACVNMAGA